MFLSEAMRLSTQEIFPASTCQWPTFSKPISISRFIQAARKIVVRHNGSVISSATKMETANEVREPRNVDRLRGS